MPTEISTHARDGSSFTVACSFTDEDGNAVAPNTLTWTLLSPSRAVVNSREDVAVSTPAATTNITLGADDLAYSDGPYRLLILTWTYDSSYGNDLTGREQVEINIDDIEEIAA